MQDRSSRKLYDSLQKALFTRTKSLKNKIDKIISKNIVTNTRTSSNRQAILENDPKIKTHVSYLRYFIYFKRGTDR